MKLKKMIFLSITLAACFFSSCSNNLSNSNKSTEKQNFSNCSIINWSKYKAIGAGFVNQGENRAAETSEEQSKKVVSKLVGITEDGFYETVTFEDDDGNTIEQNMFLAGFKAFNKFTFIAFSSEEVKEIGAFNNIGPNLPEYVIYNPTGKIYSLDIFEYINLFTHSTYDESENSIFFGGKLKNDDSYDYIYELTIENDQLAIKKKIDTSKINGWYCVASDRYGNIYSYDDINNWYNYILTTDGTLKKLNGIYVKGMNNIVYEFDVNNYFFPSSEGNYKPLWINRDGNIEEASFTPEKYFYKGIAYTEPDTYADRLLQDSNSFFYRHYSTEGFKIVKITFLDEEKISYEYEECEISFATNTYLVANERLYFLDNDQIFYVNIKNMDGIKHVIISDYFFKTILSDKLGNIYFTGVDAKLNDVSGIIDVNDNVKVSKKNATFEIVYINPLN